MDLETATEQAGHIRARQSRSRPPISIALHESSPSWLSESLAEPFDGRTVVVTHHAPSARSVPPRFATDFLTRVRQQPGASDGRGANCRLDSRAHARSCRLRNQRQPHDLQSAGTRESRAAVASIRRSAWMSEAPPYARLAVLRMSAVVETPRSARLKVTWHGNGHTPKSRMPTYVGSDAVTGANGQGNDPAVCATPGRGLEAFVNGCSGGPSPTVAYAMRGTCVSRPRANLATTYPEPARTSQTTGPAFLRQDHKETTADGFADRVLWPLCYPPASA